MARETDPKKRIVITGMGLCSVFGNDYNVFYDALLAGTSGVQEIDRFDTTDFPTRFAAQIKNFDSVRRCKVNSDETNVESAWLQRLELKSEAITFNFCFPC